MSNTAARTMRLTTRETEVLVQFLQGGSGPSKISFDRSGLLAESGGMMLRIPKQDIVHSNDE